MSEARTNLPAGLCQHRLFSGLGDEDRARIAAAGSMLRVRRGDRLLRRGDRVDGVYLVLTGVLKLYVLSRGGNERSLRIVQSGDSFGEALMFNRVSSPVFLDALTAGRLLFLPRAAVRDALGRQPAFTDNMLCCMGEWLRDLIVDLEHCCFQNASQRTLGYLLDAAGETSSAPVEVCLPASKAVVASTLNMSAETFSRELHQLQERGLIAIHRRVIHLCDPAGMLRLLEGSANGCETRH
jgi:CRP-like cAMP-binding protein